MRDVFRWMHLIHNTFKFVIYKQPNTVDAISVKTISQSKDTRCLMSFPLQHPNDKHLSPVIECVIEVPVGFHFLSIHYSVVILESNLANCPLSWFKMMN